MKKLQKTTITNTALNTKSSTNTFLSVNNILSLLKVVPIEYLIKIASTLLQNTRVLKTENTAVNTKSEFMQNEKEQNKKYAINYLEKHNYLTQKLKK